MNDLLRPLFNLLPGMWDRRWIGLITAWVVLLLGGVGVALYHERYMASARVYVDTQTLLKPLMQGLTVQPNIDDQVAMVARTLLSRPNLERLVRENHLVVDDGRPDATNRAVDQLFKNIKLNINARENLYSVSYVNPNPQVALHVVQDLVNMFLTSGIGGKQQDTQQALNFLDAQIADYGRQLSSAEQKLKDFKTAHPGYSGQANVDYYTRVNQASDQLSQMQGQLSAAIAARNAIAAQMRGESPTITVTSPYVAAPAAGGGHAAAVVPPDVLDIEQRIQTQRKVCGVVASFVVSQLMPTYHSPRQLREAIDRPVLGSISLLNSAQTAARQRRDHLNLAFSVAALVLIGIVWAIWAHLQRAFGA